jgi:prepilin-type processing-associated H-X9-DG protein
LRKFSYRHPSGKQVGIAAAFFDGHAERLSESQSRLPDYWWPKGTAIPLAQMNQQTFLKVAETMLAEPDQMYHVRR